MRENSHLLKHVIEDHPGKKVDEVKFGMRVKLTFKSALERQVTEAVEIHQAQLKGYKLLNSNIIDVLCPALRWETIENC